MNDTKTMKPIINLAFVAFSGDIITNYNDFYCLFYALCCIVPRKHYYVCICDRRNDKQQALLYTAQNSHSAGSNNNTTARIIVPPLSLRIHLGGVLQILPHRDVDMWGRV